MHQCCKGEEHTRYEIDTELKGNQKYRAVGICRICGTKKYYPHLDDNKYKNIIVPSKPKDVLPFSVKRERRMFLSHNLVGGL